LHHSGECIAEKAIYITILTICATVVVIRYTYLHVIHHKYHPCLKNTIHITADAEGCENGNEDDTDGCYNNCTVNPLFAWSTVDDLRQSVWEKIWGNGVIDNREQWDDGNDRSGDGCRGDWTGFEDGWSWVNDLSGNPVTKCTSDDEILREDKILNTWSSASVQAVMGLVALQSATKMKIDTNFWMMANVMQYIRALCLLNVNLPANLKDYLFSKFKIFSFHIPSIFIEAPYADLSSKEISEDYTDYGIESNRILVYIYADIILMVIAELIIVISFFIFGIISSKCNKSTWIKVIFNRLGNNIAFNLNLRVLIELWLNIFLVWIYEIKQMEFESNLQIISFSFAIIWLTIILGFIFFAMKYYFAHKNPEDWTESIKELASSLKQSRKSVIAHNCLFFGK
jgi:cysteine-rich repeat protein